MKQLRSFLTRISAGLSCFLALYLPAAAALGTVETDGLLDLETIKEAGGQVSPEKYPNATDVLVDDHIRVAYEPDGRSVMWDDTVVKVLNEKGRREHETLSFYFTLPYSELEVTLLQVIKPDGTSVPVDVKKQSRVMIDQSQMRSNIYNPNRKVLQVGVPDLQIMDMVRFVSCRRIVKPRVPNTWSEYEVFEYTHPIRHLLYEVLAPASLPLRSIALEDEVPGTVTHAQKKEGDRILYTWEVKDVPRMFEEPNMPPIYTVVQRLLLSTIPDWETVSRWYWELSEPHFGTTAAMEDKVRQLTEGKSADKAQIRSIFRFVSQEIRYMGITIEKEAPGYEPHDVSLTFNNRHGVCRDKAALLVAMLRLAGFKAFPVLIHVGPKKDETVPQPYFNHAITAVEQEDGNLMLMDSTDENTKQLFPAYLCNMSYLVAKPEGEDLKTSPIIPAEENLLQISTRGEIDAEGNLMGESLLSFDGINDNAYRGYFSRLKPNERKRYFEGVIKDLAAGTKLTGLEIQPEDMMNTEVPLEVRLRFEAKDVLISQGPLSLLPMPMLGARVGMVNFILGKTGLKERKYPLDTGYACGVRESVDLDLVPSLGNSTSLPSFPVLDEETLRWSRSIRKEASAVSAQGEFLLKAVEFSPDQYKTLRGCLEEIEYQSRKRPMLKRSSSIQGEQDDVLVLQSQRHFKLENQHRWTLKHKVRKRILTYKGKKENSEIKVRYNPIWEEVRLLSAHVFNGEERQEISEQETNLMDASWVGSAPRYPAGKILVASLPSVEIGSVIEYELEHTCFDRPFFFTRQSFQSKDPIEEKSVLVEAPGNVSLHCWSQDPQGVLQEEQNETDGVVSRSWTAKDQKGVSLEDQLPPWWSLTPTVALSSGTWKDLSHHVRDGLFQELKGSQKVLKGLKRKLGKDPSLTEIRNHVSKSVRLSGPSLDEVPLSALSPPLVTYREGYGNSADRAILLYGLTKAAGYRPRFVLASWSPLEKGLQEQLLQSPSPLLFPEVLVRVKRKNSFIYLNDTHQYAMLGTTPHEDRLGLLLRKKKPLLIEPSEGMKDRREENYLVRIDGEGTALIEKTVYHFGSSFAAKHRLFEEIPPEERRRYHMEALGELSQSAEPIGPLTTDFSTYPGVERFTVRIPRFAVLEPTRLYFELPGSLEGLFRLRSSKRKHPLFWSQPQRLKIKTAIRFEERSIHPRQFLFVPPSIDWSAPKGVGFLRIQTRSEEGADLVVVQEVKLDAAVLPREFYDSVYEIARQLNHPKSRTIMVKTTPVEEGS